MRHVAALSARHQDLEAGCAWSSVTALQSKPALTEPLSLNVASRDSPRRGRDSRRARLRPQAVAGAVALALHVAPVAQQAAQQRPVTERVPFEQSLVHFTFAVFALRLEPRGEVGGCHALN